MQFRDSAIHIASAADGHLDLTADTSIDLNGNVDLSTYALNRTGIQWFQPALVGFAGTTAGWSITGSALGNTGSAKCPASQTAATYVIPVTIPLKVGDTITAFTVTGQIESAGGAVTLDVDLRKLTAAAGDLVDASVGAITQISKTADYAIADSKTALAEVVTATESFYFLCTATTAASTDIDFQGIYITVTTV